MFKLFCLQVFITITHYTTASGYGYNGNYEFECGPYGFTCERNNRMRLCDDTKPIGPAFVCPLGTFCNEESATVCEDAINHIEPILKKKLICHRNERLANPNVPGCKGYILCVPNGNHFQAINFKCSGNTIFNGLTRSCTSPSKYKCPQTNVTKTTPELYGSNKKDPSVSKLGLSINIPTAYKPSSIECKDYKFTVTQDESPSRATYFCPPRPARGQDKIRCTIFSNHFCITLDRDDVDQYLPDNTPYRRPRNF